MRDDGRPIALIGLMGAGKSAVAALLGERLGATVADLDAMIEADAGCSVAELFAREGEPAFRRREAALLDRVVAAGIRVIACGGGVVVDAGPRAHLKQRCRVVWLEVSPGEAARRVAGTESLRPLLQGDAAVRRLEQLLAQRSAFYAEAAELRIPTDGRTPDQVADGVLNALRAA
ncbi:MAG TPA: shikimate kinase [Candidatus Udaeobacter sp.]|jgi:shikimate kinase|nr:shikimate kinase [Candidatus Udaeobacter sp.]